MKNTKKNDNKTASKVLNDTALGQTQERCRACEQLLQDCICSYPHIHKKENTNE